MEHSEEFSKDQQLSKYLTQHKIPEVIESILTAVSIYKPSNPLLHIKNNLLKIRNNQIQDLKWDVFIEEKDLPVEKVFKPCFIEQCFFDNPFLNEKFHKQCVIAIEHHRFVIQKKCLSVLRLHQQRQVLKKHIALNNSEKAKCHFEEKLKRRTLAVWEQKTQIYMTNIHAAFKVLRKVVSFSYLKLCLMRWLVFTKDMHWKNNWFQEQALKQAEEKREEIDDLNVDFMSKLPKQVAIKIFLNLNLRERITCSIVCHAWHILLQDCALYTELDFSNSGFDLEDSLFHHVLRRYRFFLHHIKLSGCYELSSKSLISLRDCKNLQDIDLSKCKINAQVLMDIGVGCPFVTYLNLSNSTIEDACLNNLTKHFPSMRYLDISNCQALTEAGFYFFYTNKALSNLLHLNLSGCVNVNGTCITYIGQCCKILTSLILDYIPSLTDDCISKMTIVLRELRVLSLLQAVKLTDRSLKYIAIGEYELERIYIEGNKFITDVGITGIMSLKNLKQIHISDCLKVFDNGMKPCADLRLVRVINFSDCVRLTDNGLKYILEGPSAPNITELSLSNCIRIGDQSIQRIVQHCKSLICLSLAYCENVTDVGVSMISHHPKLTMLDISGCSINDYGAGALRASPNIQYVTMSECNLVTDHGLERLAKLENLKCLDISYCSNISDYGMKMLIYEKPRLTSLNIAGCKLVTNDTLSNIASVCDYMVRLNLSELKSITDKGIRFIRLGCKQVKYLNVSYCPRLNYGCITKLQQRGCEVEHTMNNANNANLQ